MVSAPGCIRDGGRIEARERTAMANGSMFERDYAEQSDGVYNGTGPSKNAHDQAKIRALLTRARNSPLVRGFWQHMLVAEGAIEAALDWTSKPWDLAPLGIHGRGSRRRSTMCAASERFIRATHQHERKNSRRSAGDSALKRGIVRARRMKESLSKLAVSPVRTILSL